MSLLDVQILSLSLLFVQLKTLVREETLDVCVFGLYKISSTWAPVARYGYSSRVVVRFLSLPLSYLFFCIQ